MLLAMDGNKRILSLRRRSGIRGIATLAGILFGTTLLVLGLMFGVVSEAFAAPSVEAVILDLESNDVQPAVASMSTTASEVDEEPARYNFASVQGISSLQVVPGGEAQGVIRFYNVDGNRITHVTLEVSDESRIPGGWVVEIDPPLHDEEVQLGDQTTTVTENLAVEPAGLSSGPIEDVPEGMVCITVPNRGYVLARVATIIIRVPDSEGAGVTGDIKITATASWLGQSGTAAIKQTRDFDFSVKTRISS